MGSRLYVGNIPFNTDETQLRTFFEEGNRQVASVKIIMDRETGRPRGFAFVDMATDEEAQGAITAFHGKEFGGRTLTVNEARERQPGERREFDRGPRTGGYQGGDNRGGYQGGGDNRPPDNRGGYQGGDNRGPDNRGGYQGGGDNRPPDNRGPDNRGGYQGGGDNRPPDNRGGYQGGGDNRGGYQGGGNRGGYQGGGDNRPPDNRGGYSPPPPSGDDRGNRGGGDDRGNRGGYQGGGDRGGYGPPQGGGDRGGFGAPPNSDDRGNRTRDYERRTQNRNRGGAYERDRGRRNFDDDDESY